MLIESSQTRFLATSSGYCKVFILPSVSKENSLLGTSPITRWPTVLLTSVSILTPEGGRGGREWREWREGAEVRERREGAEGGSGGSYIS